MLGLGTKRQGYDIAAMQRPVIAKRVTSARTGRTVCGRSLGLVLKVRRELNFGLNSLHIESKVNMVASWNGMSR